MKGDPYKSWDLVLKSLALIGLLVSAAWAFHTYKDTKEKEFYSVFWNKKLTLFLETSQAASTMATTESVDEFNTARSKYKQLFFGPLSLVEGPAVKKAMEKFNGLVPKDMVTEEDLPYRPLQQPAYRLTLELKKELATAWSQPFDEL